MKKLISEIRGDASPELKAKLNDLRKEQFELRFRGGGEDRNTSRNREIRRTIARVMTVLGERDRAGGTGGAPAAKPAAAKAAGKASGAKASGRKQGGATKKGGDKKSAGTKPGDNKQ